MPPADAEKLKIIYQQADIALHVEAFDRKNRWITKYSFSTKIIDCLSSSCAVVAICPTDHAGYQFLKGRDAAICISSLEKIHPYLSKVALKPQILYKYQKKAWDCGIQYHNRATVREKLYQDMVEICGRFGRRSMKVLQINAVNGILSTGRTTMEMTQELKRLGHQAYTAYAMGIMSEDHSYLIGCYLDRKVHALCSRIFGLQSYFSVIATLRLIHYMKTICPDIVLLHNLHSNYINLKLLLKFLGKNKIATVLILHDCWFYTGRCFHYTINNCYQWQTKCQYCPNNLNTTPTWFFDRSEKMWRDKKNYFNKLDHWAVVGVSDWITKEAEKSILSKANRLTRIYNWINLEVFKPYDDQELRRSLELEHDFIIIGVASVWVASKGLEKFIKLSKMISKNCKIMLVGTIDQNYSLPSDIISIPLTHDCVELARYYSMSDVLVSFSLEESFGKVVAEAIACGTPAVVYHSTALPELVGDGCGYVTKENTLEEIHYGIEQVMTNTKRYYTPNCLQFAEEHFDMHKCVKEYEALFQSLISKPD
jgi:glycosyltransferase involved in cell wall biosynthesis